MSKSKKKLILITGLPGSGKSTYGREIAKKYHLTYIDYDTVIGSFVKELATVEGKQKSYSEVQREWRECGYQSFWNLIIENLRIGLPVLASAPLSAERRDQMFFTKLETRYQIDLEVLSIALELSSDILYQRVLSRNEERDQEKLRNWEKYYRKQNTEVCWDAGIKIRMRHNGDDIHMNEVGKFLQEYEAL